MRTLISRAAALAAAAVAVAVPAAAAAATGAPVLSWAPTSSPATYNYGTLTPGHAVAKTFTLANSGGAATSALKITLAGASAFTKTTDTCTGTSLGPKKTCTVAITYTAPAAPGQNNQATLTATSANPKAAATLALAGATAKATPALTTAPGAGGAAGSAAVTDTATLSGGSAPAGTIEFQLYGPNGTADCSGTPVFDRQVSVTGDGAYPSPAYTPAQAGTYWWTARYSGDTANTGAVSGCGAEQVAITKAAPALTASPAAGGHLGSTVTDTATLSGGSAPAGTVEFQLYGPSATADCSGTPVFDQQVSVTGDGAYTSPTFTPAQKGTYWWTAAYTGDTSNTPAATSCGDQNITITAALYWANPGTGTIMAAGLDGTSPQAIVTGQNNPAGVAVNGSHLYWANAGDGTIWEAGLDGSNPQAIVTGQNNPTGVAVNGSHLYWANHGNYPDGGTIWEAGLDGSNPQAIVTGQGNPFGVEAPEGVAADGSHLYWADYDGPIMEAGLDGTGPQAIADQYAQVGVAVDGSHLYWVNNSDTGDGSIWKAGLDGTSPQAIVTGQADPLGVAVDGSHLYWANDGTIWEAGLDGTSPQAIVTGQNAAWMAVVP